MEPNRVVGAQRGDRR